MLLAPVVLFAYNRPEHLRRTVASLQANPLAAQSRLYVFSDGPKTPAHAPAVAEVRDFLTGLEGFSELILNFSPENKGLAASVIAGVTRVFETHDRAIVLEDDLQFSGDFLPFMNAALTTYAPRSDVFSVSGYLYPIAIPPDYPHDVLLLPRASSWGWATWRDRWQQADWAVTNYPALHRQPAARRPLLRGGEDLWPMLQRQQRGLNSSWAVRWSLTHAAHNACGVYPVASKVRNTGADGSGTHVGKTRHFEVTLSEKPLHLNPDVQPDARLARNLRRYFRLSPLRRLLNWLQL